MKYVKMLGLAAVAAAALMAFMGASAASAATLKSTGSALSAPVTIHAQLKSAVAVLRDTSGGLVDECEESTVEGTTTNTNTPITGHIGTLSWGKCDFTTKTLVNGSLTINEKSEVSGNGSTVTVNVGVTCNYGTGAGTKLGTLKTGVLDINAVINEQEPKSIFCPDTTVWDAEYEVTSPHDLTVG